MSYNVYFIAGDYSRQAAKAPPPRAPAVVVSTLRPKSEVRPALPITDGTASFDPPRRPPGPMSVVLEDVQKIGRPPAAPSSLAPLQRPPLRSRSSRSRRPRQTRSRSDSRARSRSPDLVSVKFDQRLALYSKPIIHTHQGIGKLHLEYLIFTVTAANFKKDLRRRHHHPVRWCHRPFVVLRMHLWVCL